MNQNELSKLIQGRLASHLEPSTSDEMFAHNIPLYKSYLKLLGKLGEYDPELETHPRARLALEGAKWAEEDPEAFLLACEDNPATALMSVKELWHELDAWEFEANYKRGTSAKDSFGSWKTIDSSYLYALPYLKTVEPDLALQACLNGGSNLLAFTKETLETLSFKDLLELLKDWPEGTLTQMGDFWARTDPKEFLTACLVDPDSSLGHLGRTALAWHELRPEDFWLAVESRVDWNIQHAKNIKEKENSKSEDLRDDPSKLPFPPEVFSLIAKERPETLKRLIPALHNNSRERSAVVHAIGNLWYEVDPEGCVQTLIKHPGQLPLMLAELDAASRTQLLEALQNTPRARGVLTNLEKDLKVTSKAERDRDNFVEQLLDWTSSRDSALSNLRSVTYYYTSSNEFDKEKNKQALLWLLGQVNTDNLIEDDLSYILQDDALLEDPEVAVAILSKVPSLPNRMMESYEGALGRRTPYAHRQSYDYSDISKEYGQELDLPGLLNNLSEHSEIILENFKANHLEMGETWQTILNVILNEGQTQNLVTWILENPSIGPDAVSWAASKATNLPKPSKVKVRPRKDKDLGLGVS